MLWSLFQCLIVVTICFSPHNASSPCPPSESKVVCRNNLLFKFTIQYQMVDRGCEKEQTKVAMPIKCPAPTKHIGKCMNGHQEEVEIYLRIVNCRCKAFKHSRQIPCKCPATQTIREKCIDGKQRVITRFAIRRQGQCMMRNRMHYESCHIDQRSSMPHGVGCRCYAFGGGNIVTYDGKHLLLPDAAKCDYQLAAGNEHQPCQFAVFAHMFKGSITGISLTFGQEEYLFSSHKRLFINKRPVKVPYENNDVRIFYSGEFLQFVSLHCGLSLGFNGYTESYIYVNHRLFQGRLLGVCGDCDGSAGNDGLQLAGNMPKHCHFLSRERQATCHSPQDFQLVQSHRYCGDLHLPSSHQSAFHGCPVKHLLEAFYRACIHDVCANHEFPLMRRRATCRIHSIAAEACSEKGYLPRWRRPDFCPVKCGAHQQYLSAMEPCPLTCENHFFGTELRCFKLPLRDGCQCKKGYILDGSQCVRPTQCRCLDSVCIDRYNRQRCMTWRKMGKCQQFPRIMSEFCRLSCGFCKPQCADQMSDKRCHEVKMMGKCKEDFYRQMCRLTCNPQSCECPKPSFKKTKCHKNFKTRKVMKISYQFERSGKCTKLMHIAYEKCGNCHQVVFLKRSKCDFCKGVRTVLRRVQYREKGGKYLCKRILRPSTLKCGCPHKQKSRVVCLHGSHLVRETLLYFPHPNCQQCAMKKISKSIKNIACRGRWTERSKCDAKTGLMQVIHNLEVLHQCKCRRRKEVQIMHCSCHEGAHVSTDCAYGDGLERVVTRERLQAGQCERIRQVSKIPTVCDEKPNVRVKCDRSSCEAVEIVRLKRIEDCKCVMRITKHVVGRCCCPKAKFFRGKCNGRKMQEKLIYFVLVNGECFERVKKRELNCECPPRRNRKFCIEEKGKLVQEITFARLVDHKCKYFVHRKEIPIICSGVKVETKQACNDANGNGYKILLIKRLIRQQCQCKWKVAIYKEPCKCLVMKPHNMQIHMCPKTCHKDCTDDCYFVRKWLVVDLDADGKCITKVVSQHKKPCCCPKLKREKRICVKQRFLKHLVRHLEMHDNKCIWRVQQSVEPVKCELMKKETTFGPKQPDGTFNILHHEYSIQQCACKVSHSVQPCRWKCPLPKMVKFCDKLTNKLVTKVVYSQLRGCECFMKEKVREEEIQCDDKLNLLKKHCDPKTKEETLLFQMERPDNCVCRKIIKKKFQKCDCPPPRMVRMNCDKRHDVQEKVFEVFRLRAGACLRSVEVKKQKVQCDHEVVRRIVCEKKSGTLHEIVSAWMPANCKCHKKVKVLKKGFCHCKSMMRQLPMKEFCDEENQVLVRVFYHYTLSMDGQRCQKHEHKKRLQTHCPEKVTRRHSCDLSGGFRVVEYIFYHRIHCVCKKVVKKVKVPCGCSKGQPRQSKTKHLCNRNRGEVIFITTRWKWLEEADKCILEKITRVKALNCHQRMEVIRSDCRDGKYKEEVIQYHRDTRLCRCIRDVKMYIRDCRCPTKVIKEKCPQNEHFSKLIVIHKKWEKYSESCHTSGHRSVLQRCRCPPGDQREKCFNGLVVAQHMHYKLEHNSCKKLIQEVRFQRQCPHKVRYRLSRCHREKGCHRMKAKYISTYDPKRCRCYWKRVNVEKCKCCGCPKRQVATRCLAHRVEESTVVYYTIDFKKCSNKCERHSTNLHRTIECPPRKLRAPHWTPCDREKCTKRLIRYIQFVRNCQCQIKKIMEAEKSCCCHQKPSKETKCHKGAHVTILHIWHLVERKCVPRRVVRRKHLSCDQPEHPFIREKCNPHTCLQKMHILKRVVDPDQCKCREIQVPYRALPCCCSKANKVMKKCVGDCEMTIHIQWDFNYKKRGCVKIIERSKKCPKCPPPHIRHGHCNRHSCLQEEFLHRSVVKQCECHEVVEKKVNRCCCPPAQPWSTLCDSQRGLLKKEKIFFKLVEGHCSRRKALRVLKVSCDEKGRPYKKIAQKCSLHTCERVVLLFFRRRRGCHCVKHVMRHVEKCCCPPKQVSLSCVRDRHREKVIVEFHLAKGHCKKSLHRIPLGPVPPCLPKLIKGRHCNEVTHHRHDVELLFKAHHCRCVKVAEKRLKHRCRCPPEQVKEGRCNTESCVRKVFIVKFHHSKMDNRCIFEKLVRPIPCCCLGPKMSKQIGCHVHSGMLEVKMLSKHFQPDAKKCLHQVTVKRKPVSCSDRVKVFRGDCNPRDGHAIDKLESWHLLSSACKCVPRVRHHRRICSCKHIPCREAVIKCLDGETLLIKKICFQLHNHKCATETVMLKKKIMCSPHRKQLHKCSHASGCKGHKITIWFEQRNCKCVERRHVQPIRCCCPPTEVQKKCLPDNTLLIIKKQFRLDQHKAICHSFYHKRQVKLHCKRDVVKHVRCNPRNCWQMKLVRRERAVNCHCVPVKSKLLRRKCCCPRSKGVTKCFDKYNMMQHVRYKYKLDRGECIAEKKVVQTRVGCPPPVYLRTKCSRSSKKRTVKKVYFQLQRCRCHKREKVTDEFCACPKPSYLKEPCTPKKVRRAVLKVSWDLRGEHGSRHYCVKKLRKIDEEPCICPPSRVNKICRNRKIFITMIKHMLVHQQGRQFCVTKETEKYETIRCPATVRHSSACHANVRLLTTVFYRIDNCQCKQIKQVKEVACDCFKLNKKKQYCHNNFLHIENHRFFNFKGHKRCIVDVKKDFLPIACNFQKVEVPLDKHCRLLQHHGYYREFMVTWQVLHNCKCETRTEKVKKLCQCAPSRSNEQCIGDDTVRVYRSMYLRDGERCLPRQEAMSKEIRCDKAERQVTHGKCLRISPDKCIQIIRVVENFVKDCRCQARMLQFKRLCCTPAAISQHLCDNVKGIRIKKTITFDLEPDKILYQAEDVQIEDLKSVRNVNVEQQEVTCPEPHERERCNRQTGRWSKEIVTHYQKDCICQRKVKHLVGRCKCPPSKVLSGRCANYFRKVEKIYFEILDHQCVRHVRRWRQRCRCPSPVRHRYCDNKGRWVNCFTKFVLNPESFSCRLIKDCVRKRHRCPKSRIEESKCHPERHLKKMTQIDYLLDEEHCQCREKRRFWLEYCSCHHLNRKHVSCRDGVIFTSNVIHTLREGECIPTQIKKKRQVDCPKKRPKIFPCNRNPNSPHQGLQLKRYFEWISTKCNCQPRHQNIYVPCDCHLLHPPQKGGEKCRKHSVLLTIEKLHRLQHGRCVPHTVVNPRHIKCDPQARRQQVEACKVNEDGIGRQVVITLQQKPVHCKCIWVPIERKMQICKCPEPQFLKKCLHGEKMIVKILRTFRPDHHLQHCVANEKSQHIPIVCHTPPPEASPCDVKKCLRRVHIYESFVRNCRCHRKLDVKHLTCCCPPPSPRRERCKEDGRTLLTTWHTYHLQANRCFPQHQMHSVRVRCERRKPIIVVGKCTGKLKPIRLITFITVNCRCEERVQESKELCGCPKRVKHVATPCRGDWLHEKWIALKFIEESKKCVPVVLREQRRRCRCPQARVKRICKRDNLMLLRRVIFHIKEKTNSCEKQVVQDEELLDCPLEPKLLEVVKGHCSEKTNFHQVDKFIFLSAKKCRCLKIIKVKKWPCNCKALHPPKTETHCLQHHIIEKRFIVHKNWKKKCRLVVKKALLPIECKGKRMKRGECDVNKGKQRWMFFYKKVAKDCQCVWKVVKKMLGDCYCPKPRKFKKCFDTFMEEVIVLHSLVHDRCEKHVVKKRYAIPCPLKPIVESSPCNQFNGFRTITTVMHKISNCQCLKSVRKHKCKCACAEPERFDTCDPKYGVKRLVTVRYQLKECSCFSMRDVATVKIQCNKPISRLGSCRVMDPIIRDKWRLILRIQFVREECKCKKLVLKEKQLCSCEPMPKKVHQCFKDNVRLYLLTKRVNVMGRCKRVVVQKKEEKIRCGEVIKSFSCNTKTGYEVVTVETPFIRDCACHKRIRHIRRQKCKCNEERRFLRRVGCNKHCISKMIFTFEALVNGLCQKKFTALEKRCCCPHKVKLIRHCLRRSGIIEMKIHKRKLKNGECVPVVERERRKINCDRQPRTHKMRLADGVLKIVHTFSVRSACKCKTKEKFEFAKWKCPESEKKRRCISVPEPAIEETQFDFHILKHGTNCKRIVRVRRIPITCPDDERQETVCQKHRFGSYRMMIVKEFIIKHCHCVPVVRNIPHICQCNPPEKQHICESKTGVSIEIVTKFLPNVQLGQCIPKKFEKKFQVHCHEPPRLLSRSKCEPSRDGLMRYWKIVGIMVREGCKCVLKKKRSPCLCVIPLNKKLKKCHANILEEIFIRHIRTDCNHFQTHQSSHLLPVHCPPPEIDEGKCDYRSCERKVVKVLHHKRNCQCRKQIQHLKVKCCCPKSFENQHCHKAGHKLIRVLVTYKLSSSRHECVRRVQKLFTPIECDQQHQLEVAGSCVKGRQKFLFSRFLKRACGCVRVKKFIFKRCICSRAKRTDIVFLLDETLGSRYHRYSQHLFRFLKRSVLLLLSQDKAFRLAMVKYSMMPSVAMAFQEAGSHESMVRLLERLPFSGHHSNLGRALHLVRTELLPNARKDADFVILLVTDGINFQAKNTLEQAKRLRQLGVHIGVIAIRPSAHSEHILRQISSHGQRGGFVALRQLQDLDKIFRVLTEQLCGTGCPPSRRSIQPCSRESGCLGRVIDRQYNYDEDSQQCVSKARVREQQCCCLQKPRKQFICAHRQRHIVLTVKWKFHKGKCLKLVRKMDDTERREKECQPGKFVIHGRCREDGHMSVRHESRLMDDCKCQRNVRWHQADCRCPPPRSFHKCHANGFLKIKIRIAHTLRDFKCIKQKQLFKRPIQCPPKKTEVSKCDPMSCEQEVRHLTFVPVQCHCKGIVKTHRETCCCPRHKTVKVRDCLGHHVKVVTEKWLHFNYLSKSCETRMSEKKIPTDCDKKAIQRFGSCGIQSPSNAPERYHIVEVIVEKTVQCECRKMRRVEKKLCGCRRPIVFKKCENGKIVIWEKFYLLNRMEKRCDEKRKIVEKKMTVCPVKVGEKVGPCKPLREAEARRLIHLLPPLYHQHHYRRVVTTRMRRVGCGCVPREEVQLQICTCPSARQRNLCLANHVQVMVMKRFHLQKPPNRPPRCVPQILKRRKDIRCPPPKFRAVSKCFKGKVEVQVLLYHLTRCHCEVKRFVRIVPCAVVPDDTRPSVNQVILPGPHGLHKRTVIPRCMDLLPQEKCAEFERRPFSICDRPGRMRDGICRRTCKRCYPCMAHDMNFRITYKSCLVTDKRYRRRYLLDVLPNKPYNACRQLCLHRRSCLSFDYFVTKKHHETFHSRHRFNKFGTCILNKVDHQALQNRIFPMQPNLGASLTDLIRHAAQKCFLSTKMCNSKCRPPVVKVLQPCQCFIPTGKSAEHSHRRHDSLPPHEPKLPRKHCFQKVVVLFAVQNYLGHCLDRQWEGELPCDEHACHNRKSDNFCLDAKRHGKCADPHLAQVCAKTCRECHCGGTFVYKGRCRKSGRRLDHRIAYRRHPQHGKCIIDLQRDQRPCAYCSEGTFKLVHKCTGGRRLISTVSRMRRSDGSCDIRTRHRMFSCRGCNPTDTQEVSTCQHGRLRFVTFFSMNDPALAPTPGRNCCRLFREERTFPCRGCPPHRVTRTPCSYGYRLRHIFYHVRVSSRGNAGPPVCVRRVISRQERCRSLRNCVDVMPREDCVEFRKTRQCIEKPKDAKRLCAETCGIC